MAKYLIIKRLDILKANANPVWYLVGPPALTAYHGFIQALLLNLVNDDINDAKKIVLHEGFAIIHHHIQMLGSWNKYKNVFLPNQISSSHAYDKNDYVENGRSGARLSSQPTATCNLLIDLIIKLPSDIMTLDINEVKKFLYGGNIAGGQINVANSDVEPQISIAESLSDVKKHINSGFYIIDRHDLLKASNGKNPLDLLLEKTQILKDKSGSKEWLVPNSVGYLCLTEFEQRENSRNGNLVAYAEPLVTLTEYRSIRKTPEIPFWIWSKEVTKNGKTLFKLTGEKNDSN